MRTIVTCGMCHEDNSHMWYVQWGQLSHVVCVMITIDTCGICHEDNCYMWYVWWWQLSHVVCVMRTIVKCGMCHEDDYCYMWYVSWGQLWHAVCVMRTIVTCGMCYEDNCDMRYVSWGQLLHVVCVMRTIVTCGMCHEATSHLWYMCHIASVAMARMRLCVGTVLRDTVCIVATCTVYLKSESRIYQSTLNYLESILILANHWINLLLIFLHVLEHPLVKIKAHRI